MPVMNHQELLSAHLTTRGLHAKALLDANEERINALHSTLRLLEQERHELCGKFQGTVGLTATEINWVFRPAAPLMSAPGNYC